jgi:hypothetical protein
MTSELKVLPPKTVLSMVTSAIRVLLPGWWVAG